MTVFKLSDGSDFLLSDGSRFLVGGDVATIWLPVGIAVIGLVCVVLIDRWATHKLAPRES